jgi:hypothetical protein
VALLADYWQKTTKRIAEKWRFAEVDIFMPLPLGAPVPP